ncbi:uncharacterized protein NPIL_110851 [Nephila pilipes]|uniref:Uncharacterized protein n=1 Tax=Nephila pilipes TaxID=299642 RepID=A0A8X6QAY6_NEPPI|nr:uncharacterized protein NPIL_110851 [Nephila pilipes]
MKKFFLCAESCRDKYSELSSQIEKISLKESAKREIHEKRNFKLPKIELKKFSGDARDYLAFWSQFQKNQEDSSIVNEVKFQHLLQAIVPKSKAARVVSAVSQRLQIINYPKAVAQLRERFGREDVLVQIYVRELLSMVMKNAAIGHSKTQEKFADFLSPLVESYLSEEILVAWERSRNRGLTKNYESRNLEHLMNFLRQKVKGEEMVNLARTGFASHQNPRRKEFQNEQSGESSTASA